MEPIRTFVDVEGDTITVPVPEELRNQRIEVILKPALPVVANDVQVLHRPNEKKKLSHLAGSITGEAAESLDAHLRQTREEWQRTF